MVRSPAPSRIGRYEVLERIASGGMGSVYLARLRGVHGFERLVAIKQPHEHLRTEQDFIRMFLDEARLAARIHHPNVVSISEIGEDEHGFYLVMDYVDGTNVHRLINAGAEKGRSLPIPVALRIAADALAGLSAAHELKDADGSPLDIVHRDVSPQNIIVGFDGLARLTDFGVARARSRLYQSRTSEVKGKMGYMAPEQVQARQIDRRTDLFAMGVVLWEMIAAQPLFHGASDAETIDRLLYRPTPRLADVIPNIEPLLDALCARALERDPAQRFPTADAMLDAVEAAAKKLGAATQRDVASCVGQMLDAPSGRRQVALARPVTESAPASLPPGGGLAQVRSTPAGGTDVSSFASTVRAVPGSAYGATPPTPGRSSGQLLTIAIVSLLAVLSAVVLVLVQVRAHRKASQPPAPAVQLPAAPPIAQDEPIPGVTSPATPLASDAAPTGSTRVPKRPVRAPPTKAVSTAAPSASSINAGFGDRL
jgi:eukaryotic-like serine/threonine-protein kinase